MTDRPRIVISGFEDAQEAAEFVEELNEEAGIKTEAMTIEP